MLYKARKVLFLGLLLISVIICGVQDLSAAGKKNLVVIDPAHGGQDSGVNITDKVGEKDITLAIALALQKELARDGNFEIVLTRDSDNDEIASTLARFVRYHRSYDTLNQLYRTAATVTADDLLAAAKKYVVDGEMVVTTLSREPMPAAMADAPGSRLARAARRGRGRLASSRRTRPFRRSSSSSRSGPARPSDPKGKEGLAALTASMICRGRLEGDADRRDQARPSTRGRELRDQVDKELTTFTAVIHKDNWKTLADVALPQLVDPGFREEDFKRLKDQQRNALTQNLRSFNEEELGQGEASGESLRRHSVRSHRPRDRRGTERHHARRREGLREGRLHAGGPDRGDLGRRAGGIRRPPQGRSRQLPAGPALAAPAGVVAQMPKGLEVEIIQKETRATAISFGKPIDVTRAHPDFAALSVAKVWLGEHRSSQSHLYQRIRELRGMNYGDYAYIEAFPRGMYQFFPDPNIPRRSQLFEVWIRPVVPENGHDGAPDRALRAREADQGRPHAGRLRGHARIPDEERLSPHLDAERAARLRDRLGLVRHPGVHLDHEGKAREADARGGQRRHPEAPLGDGPLGRHHHEGRRRG